MGIGLGGPDQHIDLNSKAWLGEADSIISSFRPDILINNAGTMELNRFNEYRSDQLNKSIQVNLYAPLKLMQLFMLGRIKGIPSASIPRVINTTSMAVRTPPRECVGYVASKAGLEAATRALAREIPEAIFCCIAPAGVADTDMQRKGLDHLQKVRGMTPEAAARYQGRLITHDELWEVYRFAVEDMPHAMSGTVLTIPLACGV